MKPFRITVVVVLVIAAAAGWLVYPGGAGTPSARELDQRLEATVLPAGIARFPRIRLASEGGGFSRADFAGSWTLLFMGYTSCPDVCPTTLAGLSVAVDQMRKAGVQPPRVLFVSVDYRRDEPAEVAKYAGGFDKEFLGATAEESVLRRLADSLNVTFTVPEELTSGDLVEHSSALFLLDPKGRVRAIFGSPQDPTTIAREVPIIRDAL